MSELRIRIKTKTDGFIASLKNKSEKCLTNAAV